MRYLSAAWRAFADWAFNAEHGLGLWLLVTSLIPIGALLFAPAWAERAQTIQLTVLCIAGGIWLLWVNPGKRAAKRELAKRRHLAQMKMTPLPHIPAPRSALPWLFLILVLALVYVTGRRDGARACELGQAQAVAAVEQRASKAREKVRRSVPTTSNVDEILNWLETYAVDRTN